MQRKAIGSIVATVILVLVAVVGTAIFIGAYLKSVDKNTSSDSSSCFGIELKLDNCAIITPQMVNLSLPLNLQITGPALLMNVERMPGGKEINGLRFVVTDNLGGTHLEEPVDISIPVLNFAVDTNYSDLVEYSTVGAVVRNLTYNPSSVAVSAVVGKSGTICSPTREPIACRLFGT